KQVKVIPLTTTLTWNDPFAAVVYHYCPEGYWAVSAQGMMTPVSGSGCGTSVFNNPSTGINGSVQWDCYTNKPGDTAVYHQLVCAKFQ
ncbi:TPA: hypothetical protein ACQQ5N_006719, partial [Pseudomonas aeruginosa]